ncbi:DUF2236 domain-containing protein [Streptomyces sp. JJ36]|nr:DUF2236 domain-containing protein [Streptomyces sp. JJ36]
MGAGHQSQVRPPREEPGPPPAGGLLWELVGEVRSVLTLPAATALQVAHPAVGAGVDAHSAFRTDLWGRAGRSLHSMQLWVYGGEQAAAEGARLRHLHAHITGRDGYGRPYRALDPALYGWVLATGYPVMRHAHRYLGRPFTADEERRLWAEWRQVGGVLGLREEDLPRTVEEFWPYYRRVLAEELEATAVVRDLVAPDGPLPPPPGGPAPVRLLVRVAWPAVRPPLLRLRRFLITGLLPPDAREAVGLPWTPRQERRLRRFGAVVRVVVPRLPEPVRYLPVARRARAAHRRGTGGRGGRPCR